MSTSSASHRAPRSTLPPPPSPPRTQGLHAFFNPTGVAIVGASADSHKLSHGVLRNMLSYGYRGAVYPVNPRAESLLGLPCFPTITNVPDPVELAVLMVPAAACPAVLTACGQRGIKAAIIISGGFREVGDEGRVLEDELVRIARSHGMRLIGPNCVGTLDAHTGLNSTFIRTMPKPGPIAFVSQSGAICGGILEWTAGKGVGFSRFATLGNEADVTETDLIEALADDPNTRVIVAYVEAIQNGRRFIDVASQVTPVKPILVIKAGTTQAGTRAVSSHTGSLAGEMAAYDAAFLQSGVLRVGTVEELFNNALAIAYGPPLRGRRVAVVTNAGGPASLAADEIEHVGLAMPPTPETTRQRLAAFTHPEAQLGNPVDMLGGAEPPQYEQAVAALLADDRFDAVMPILVPQALVDPVAVAEAIGKAASCCAKPVVACFMGDDAVRQPMAALHEHQIAAYQFPEQAARALGALWQVAEGRGSEVGPVRPAPPVGQSDNQNAAGEVSALLAAALQQGRYELGEAEARPILAAYGVPQPRAEIAQTVDQAARLAVAMGFPVALKIVSPDIFHKSEVGGIVLKVGDEGTLRRAYEAMLTSVRERRPDAAIAGVLVAEMAQPGHELIVGMRRDPQFGPLLMAGLGGIYVEFLKDVAFRVAPFGRDEARRMLGETHAGKLLSGLRGQPPADGEAVVDAILAVAQLALDHPQIQEIDVNPLLVYPAGSVPGALAVDVRMVLG